MIRIECDECKKVIEDVAYTVTPVDAKRPESPSLGRTHLHWDCIIPWRNKA